MADQMTKERIAELRALCGDWSIDIGTQKNATEEALDEIERLRAALEWIAEKCHGDMGGQAQYYARDALEGK